MEVKIQREPNKWLVLFISCLMLLLVMGTLFVMGATFVTLLDTYQQGRSKTALVQSLFIGLGLGFGAVGGGLVDRCGLLNVALVSSTLCPTGFIAAFFAGSIEYLYVSISVVSGTGICLLNVCVSATIVRTVKGKQRAMFLSIAYAAPGLSTITYPYFIDWALATYGLGGMYLLIGGLHLNALTLPLLIHLNQSSLELPSSIHIMHQKKKRGISEIGNEKQGLLKTNYKPDCTFLINVLSVFVNLPFLFLLLGSASIIGALNGYMGLLFDITSWKNFTTSQTLLLFIPFAMCTSASSVLTGVIKQRQGVSSYAFPIAMNICAVAAQLLNHYTEHYIVFAVGMCLVGMSNGTTFSSALILVVKLVKQRQQTITSGLLFTFFGVFSTFLSPLFGAVRDHTGTYDYVAYATIFLYTLGLLCFILSYLVRRLKRRNSRRVRKISLSVEQTSFI